MRTPLDIATDELNEELIKVEAGLAALDLGVAAEVPLNDGHFLGFGKHEKKWSLFVRSDKDSSKKPAHQASRALRIEVAKHLHVLLEHLYGARDAQTVVVQEAVGVARQFNNVLHQLIEKADEE